MEAAPPLKQQACPSSPSAPRGLALELTKVDGALLPRLLLEAGRAARQAPRQQGQALLARPRLPAQLLPCYRQHSAPLDRLWVLLPATNVQMAMCSKTCFTEWFRH